MADLTYVARISDGLLLVASMGMHGNVVHSGSPMETLKKQAKAIIKKLGHQCRNRNATIASGDCCFHYAVADGIVYLCLTPKSYPKRLAHHYLDRIRARFVEHLQSQHGGDWQRQVATVARPYAFIKFDKVIQRERKNYADPHSRDNMTKLNHELSEVRSIMQQNIRDVLDRGEKLDHVADQSDRLLQQSKDFRWGAKRLNLMALYRQYAPFVAIGGVFCVAFYVKFFTTWW